MEIHSNSTDARRLTVIQLSNSNLEGFPFTVSLIKGGRDALKQGGCGSLFVLLARSVR